jgi:hypothetical protein
MSGKRKAASGSQRRRVAVVIESSLAGGRAILRGFAEYVRQVNHGSVFYEPNHFETSLPDWLRNWRGDGVVARVDDGTMGLRQQVQVGPALASRLFAKVFTIRTMPIRALA